MADLVIPVTVALARDVAVLFLVRYSTKGRLMAFNQAR